MFSSKHCLSLSQGIVYNLSASLSQRRPKLTRCFSALGLPRVNVDHIHMKYLLAVGAALAVLLFPFSTHAQVPAALGFDGVDDYVAVPHTNALNAYPLTVTFWMKAAETSNQRGIVNKYAAGSGNGWQVYLDGPIVHAWYFNASGGSVYTLDGGNVGDAQWHHIAFTVDASGGTIYVDGVLKQTLAWTGPAGPCTTTQELSFGQYPGGGYFNGQLDEVAIWNVALSVAQIQSGLHRSLIGSEPNLVAYYRLDEGSGLTAVSLPPGQNGTLVNGPLWVNSGGQVYPPTVSPQPASSVTTNSATLNGTVNPNGQTTTTWFQWGTTTNYGNFTTTNTLGATNAPLATSVGISGLLLGTTYHFAGVASNSSGTSTGGDLTLTAGLGSPPTVTTLSATSVSNTIATLNGTVNPNGTGTTAWFEWSTLANNYTQQTAPVAMGSGSVPLALSNALSGLVPGVLYHCRLAASNALGLARGGEIRFGSPAIILNGAALLTNECHAAYTDAGATLSRAVVAVAGDYHTLALVDGTVQAWGYNGFGQVNVPASATNLVAIAAGQYFSLALRADGTVMAWGNNNAGQANVPPVATNVVAISAGHAHSLALRADGTVVAWGGDNEYGQINVPPSATNILAISAGYFHSLALRADRTVMAWGGSGNRGQTDVPGTAINVVAIAAGTLHSQVLLANGIVIGWGDNVYGQINVPASATNVVAIATGSEHSLALRADGTVIAWGDNGWGQINVPASATNVVAIAAGGEHSLALRADGTVLAWGDNRFGQTTVPANLNTFNLVGSGNVNTDAPGSYTITYVASNYLGGVSVLTRTVIVADRTPPALSLSGANSLLWTRGVPFVEPGFTAPDTCEGDLSANVIITGTVNPNVLGTNTLTYTVTDASGNTATRQRLVIVIDTPSILSFTAQVNAANAATGLRTVSLLATVNPNGSAGSCFFRYGLKTNSLALSASLPFSASFVATNVALSLTVLSGATNYFCVVATNNAGFTNSPYLARFIPAAFSAGDRNGDGLVDQSEFNSVLSNYLATSPYLLMTNTAGLGQSNVTFALSNSLGGSFTVEFSTDLANWQNLGPATPRYSFTDTNAPAAPQRYYRLKYP
jgi:hypothetical protein